MFAASSHKHSRHSGSIKGSKRDKERPLGVWWSRINITRAAWLDSFNISTDTKNFIYPERAVCGWRQFSIQWYMILKRIHYFYYHCHLTSELQRDIESNYMLHLLHTKAYIRSINIFLNSVQVQMKNLTLHLKGK